MRLPGALAAAFAAALLASVAHLAGPARAQAPAGPERSEIAVVGEGMVAAVPDIAIVTSGVVTRAETADAALKANSAAMTKALAAVRAAGVADRDVGTSGLSLQPQYDYQDGRSPKLAGYEARNAVTIRARDVDKLGGLLDALVGAGSNQIEGLVFDVSDKDRRLDEARRAAVADARRKAELYAASAGVELGGLIAIDERVSTPGPVPQMAMRAKAMDAAPVPLARGEQELRVEIGARWSVGR